jgi:hypothetical protein
LRRKVSLENGKKPRFIISKVVTKARERTTKTKSLEINRPKDEAIMSLGQD